MVMHHNGMIAVSIILSKNTWVLKKVQNLKRFCIKTVSIIHALAICYSKFQVCTLILLVLQMII